MSIHIRPAGTTDIPTLFKIRTAVRENHMSMTELATAGVTLDAVAELLASGDAAAWLGLWEGKPSGFSMARADEGDVFALFVLPEAEGHGLGSLLLTEAEIWLAFCGTETAWLLTGGEPGLRAASFYASRGWQAAGRERDGQLRFTKRLMA
jgi:GNAT superfamily N-acetyltransferase